MRVLHALLKSALDVGKCIYAKAALSPGKETPVTARPGHFDREKNFLSMPGVVSICRVLAKATEHIPADY
jgi:hypothetical protein